MGSPFVSSPSSSVQHLSGGRLLTEGCGAGRQEKSAAVEVASSAGYEGFRIERQLLHNLESAIGRAAAAHSDKEQ